MTEKLLYFLHVGANKVGRIDAEDEQSIVIGGLGILKEHCVVFRKTKQALESEVNAAPVEQEEAHQLRVAPSEQDVLMIRANQGAKVYINATMVGEDEEVQLHHCDRLILGNANVFRVKWLCASVDTE